MINLNFQVLLVRVFGIEKTIYYFIMLFTQLPKKSETHRLFPLMATINYSFVYVLIRPTSLVLKEHFFCILSVLRGY